jgi:hypothetical protein
MIRTPPLILHRTFRWFIYVNNIKIELQEVGLGSMDWIYMARVGIDGGFLWVP